MFLVTAMVPAECLPRQAALDARVGELAGPEDRVEHLHLAPSPDGGACLTLFLSQPDAGRSEEAAALLVSRALAPAADAAAVRWGPAAPLLHVMERLRLGVADRDLPSQDPDTA
ncbi:hypothetical protein [Streptomyces sp. NPDC017890]|uniref:hypothetical protein n=1 Tax=Streptomyces sp. NPDC017890 TaxID=3365015 RepID=UPI0037A5D95F